MAHLTTWGTRHARHPWVFPMLVVALLLLGGAPAPWTAPPDLLAWSDADQVEILAGGGTTVEITERGFRHAEAGWGLDLSAWGRAGALSGVAAVGPTTTTADGVETQHPGITAWYRAREDGVEHGFTVPERPAGDGPLVVRQLPSGGLLPVVDASGDGVSWLALDGRQAGRYAGLVVTDATGTEVPAHLETTGDGALDLVVDDAAAVYPLLIDPLISDQVRLTGHDHVAGDGFGYAVAIDGTTAVVGAPWDEDRGARGSAYVFERHDAGPDRWGLARKLEPVTAFELPGRLGAAVDIDGDTIVVGAPLPGASGFGGSAAFVFGRDTGGVGAWGQQAELHIPVATAVPEYFGISVAVDGDTVVVGAPDDDGYAGGAYVFELDEAGSWGHAATLGRSDPDVAEGFGYAVDVNGTTAVVGTRGSAVDRGAAYVFERDEGGAGAWGQQAHLTSTASLGGGYGRAVAVDGDTIVIGAPGHDGGGIDAGLVQVYRRAAPGASWQRDERWFGSSVDEEFGSSVAIDGTTVAVGTLIRDEPIHDGVGIHAGGAYVFDVDEGEASRHALTAQLSLPHDHFGASVAVSGDAVMVGAYLTDTAGFDAGSASVFERDLGGVGAWGRRVTLGADLSYGDLFGFSVAVSGDTALVGAPNDDMLRRDSGAVFLFVRAPNGAWALDRKLTALDASVTQRFGWSVALDGDTAVVGVPRDRERGSVAGAFYVFGRDVGGPGAWGQEAKLWPAAVASGDQLGSAVAVRGDTIVVGAPLSDELRDGLSYRDIGSAHVFGRDAGGAWIEQATLRPGAPDPDARFGSAVAVDGDVAVVGAPRHGGAGAAFVYERDTGGTDAWGQTAGLAGDPSTFSGFGTAVDVDDVTVVVGAPHSDLQQPDGGAAYAYMKDAATGLWTSQGTLQVTEPSRLRELGVAVAVHGDTAVVGDMSADLAYVFTRDPAVGVWTQQDRVEDPEGSSGDRFGNAVALDGATAVVAANWAADAAAASSGAVSVLAIGPDRPAAPTVDMTGIIGWANAASVRVRGTGPEGTTASITIDDTDPDTAPITHSERVGPDGYGGQTVYSVRSSLTDGELTATVTLTDDAGDVSHPGRDTAVKDTVAANAPRVVAPSLVGPFDQHEANVSGHGEPGTVAVVTIDDEDTATAPVVRSAYVGAGAYQVTGDLSSLTDGTLTVTVFLRDRVGNDSRRTTTQVVLDREPPAPPTVTVTDPINAENQTSVVVSGTGEEGASASVVLKASPRERGIVQAVPVGPDGYTAVLDASALSDGPIAATVTLTDAAENRSESRWATSTKDTVAPAAPTVDVADPIDASNETAVDVTGTGEDGATADISVDDTDPDTPAVTASVPVTTGSYVATLDLSSLSGGTITATVTLTDTAGNVGPPGSDTATKAFTDELAAGETLSTGTTPTADDPLVTAVTSPVAGTVSIVESTVTATAPSGYVFVAQQVDITAPPATPDDPLRIQFQTTATGPLDVFRNGILVPECPGSTTARTPAGDPSDGGACVTSRETDAATGITTLVVLTVEASQWNLAVSTNTAPVAADDGYMIDEDMLLSVGAPGVLGNDSDVDGDDLSAVVVSGPSGGSVTLAGDGSFVYTPDADFNGTDSFTYQASDGRAVSQVATVTITVEAVNDAPVVSTIDPVSQTVQYSDQITPVTVTAEDVDSSELTLSTTGLPGAVSVGDPTCTASGSSGETCTWTLSGSVHVGAGSNTVGVSVSDGSLSDDTNTLEITVVAETASAETDETNPVAVKVAEAGGDSGAFALAVLVTETEPDLPSDRARSGDLANATVSVDLVPVGPGSTEPGVCSGPAVTGVGYDQAATFTCIFEGIPVNTYTVEMTVDGGFYTGSTEDVLTVYDPSLGSATGGGTFYWPATADPTTGYPGDRTNFGFTMNYTKTGANLKGSLLVVRHLADGTKYRIKSNALDGLALSEDPSVPMGWATFTGKTTYLQPGWDEPEGNYGFTTYVEDRNEPGTGTDRFWLEVVDKDRQVVADLSMDAPADANARDLSGGNIVVPHRSR